MRTEPRLIGLMLPLLPEAKMWKWSMRPSAAASLREKSRKRRAIEALWTSDLFFYNHGSDFSRCQSKPQKLWSNRVHHHHQNNFFWTKSANQEEKVPPLFLKRTILIKYNRKFLPCKQHCMRSQFFSVCSSKNETIFDDYDSLWNLLLWRLHWWWLHFFFLCCSLSALRREKKVFLKNFFLERRRKIFATPLKKTSSFLHTQFSLLWMHGQFASIREIFCQRFFLILGRPKWWSNIRLLQTHSEQKKQRKNIQFPRATKDYFFHFVAVG